jgi:hypothetical protein
MNPLIVNKCALNPCGHPAFVYYVTVITISDRRFDEKPVPCPFCRSDRLEVAIEKALLQTKAHATDHDQGPCRDTVDEILIGALRAEGRVVP